MTKRMSDQRDQKVAAKSTESAILNIASSVFFRFFTFFANAYILRCISPEVLGLGVRTTLLNDTLLFLSREAIRKSCLSHPDGKNWRKTINLVSLCLPVGIATSFFLCYIWSNVLDLPTDSRDQYLTAVKLSALNGIIVLATETFFIVGQAYLHVKFRSAIDLFYVCLNSIFQCIIVTWWPQKFVLCHGYASVLNALIFFSLHLLYFNYVIRKEVSSNDSHEFPFHSLADFLPSLRDFQLDHQKVKLTVSFFKLGFLKQVLTEGEKYLFTWFNLMSLGDQGIFDVISNLGSIPARLFFSKLEESAHLYFSQTVKRSDSKVDLKKEETPTRHLHFMLKALTLLGLVVCCFGPPYCHLLLHIYGGHVLSSGIGPQLLKLHCFYTMFLAFNGISECYSFCVMSQKQVANYNYKMAVMAIVFLISSYFLVKIFGPIGFVLGNCCNFSMRILHNTLVINDRFKSAKDMNPLKGLLPNGKVIIVLLVSAFVCHASEQLYYQVGNFQTIVGHILIGGLSFMISCSVILLQEEWLKSTLENLFKKKLKTDKVE